MQWEKAARGVDGRLFVWGDRFDPSFCVSSAHVGYWKISARYPAGTVIFDESVYGVRDLNGFAKEYAFRESGGLVLRGGPYGEAEPWFFRCAMRFLVEPGTGALGRGFRLVARRR
jgi:formylglycine-generating enzyme required for sulfatase activity